MTDPPRRIYANHAQAEGGPFDVAVEFGFRRGDDIDTAAVVVMSWEHAKVLGTILTQMVAGYEAQVSEVPDLLKEHQA